MDLPEFYAPYQQLVQKYRERFGSEPQYTVTGSLSTSEVMALMREALHSGTPVAEWEVSNQEDVPKTRAVPLSFKKSRPASPDDPIFKSGFHIGEVRSKPLSETARTTTPKAIQGPASQPNNPDQAKKETK